MKFVSLFAGAGGFDLGLEAVGHECVGQCEIEPVARAVLERHWPHVPKHDDVTTITAGTFEHPELVTFGSPCQDLSVAGKRAGMSDGTRSGLFHEAVRYIREIQEATSGQLPRCALWENVPGAYSSNDGRDFATVLSLLVGGEVWVPTGGWPHAGVAIGPDGGAEWRTLDSRYFGVAQRRRRVFLVYRPGADCAGSVLLEPDGVPRDLEARGPTREGTAGCAEGGAGASDDVSGALTASANRASGCMGGIALAPVDDELIAFTKVGGFGYQEHPDGVYGALTTSQNIPMVAKPVAFKVRGGVEVDSAGKSAGKGYLGSEDIALTLGVVQDQNLAVPAAYAARDYSTGRYEEADVAEAITTSADRTRAAPVVAFTWQTTGDPSPQTERTPPVTPGTMPAVMIPGAFDTYNQTTSADRTRVAPIAFALRGRDDGAMPEISGDQTNALRGSEGGSSRDYIAFDLAQITSATNRTRAEPDRPMSTLAANSDPHVAYGVVSKGNGDAFLMPEKHTALSTGGGQAGQGYPAVLHQYAVRRLTPRECERLQAFPDDWTRYHPDGREIGDTHRYRLMGNAVTVNVIEWIGRRLPA